MSLSFSQFPSELKTTERPVVGQKRARSLSPENSTGSLGEDGSHGRGGLGGAAGAAVRDYASVNSVSTPPTAAADAAGSANIETLKPAATAVPPTRAVHIKSRQSSSSFPAVPLPSVPSIGMNTIATGDYKGNALASNAAAAPPMLLRSRLRMNTNTKGGLFGPSSSRTAAPDASSTSLSLLSASPSPNTSLSAVPFSHQINNNNNTQFDRYMMLFEKAIRAVVDDFRSAETTSVLSPNTIAAGMGGGATNRAIKQNTSGNKVAGNDDDSTPASPIFASPGTIAAAEFVDPHEVAKAIASALLHSSGTNASTNNATTNTNTTSANTTTVAFDPADRVKTLLFHLHDRNNTDLRFKLATGQISGAEFVSLNTFTQLFNKRKRVEAAKARKAAEDTVFNTKDMVVASTLYECPNCKARRHTLAQIQTRSADEPLTELCSCLNCNITWRVAD